MKKYKLGMYLGRFQPFHNGHKSIVDMMLEDCEEVLIVIGSANKEDPYQNPFPIWLRMNMINHLYRGKPVHVVGIPDRDIIKNDCSWGEYVLKYLDTLDFKPNVIYQGKEMERKTWFESYDIPVIEVTRLNIPISGTMIRAAISEHRFVYVHENCPEEICCSIINCLPYCEKIK